MNVLDEVKVERLRQVARWGPAHDARHSWLDWESFMLDRIDLLGSAAPAAERRRALIELAALAIAAIEANEGGSE